MEFYLQMYFSCNDLYNHFELGIGTSYRNEIGIKAIKTDTYHNPLNYKTNCSTHAITYVFVLILPSYLR